MLFSSVTEKSFWFLEVHISVVIYSISQNNYAWLRIIVYVKDKNDSLISCKSKVIDLFELFKRRKYFLSPNSYWNNSLSAVRPCCYIFFDLWFSIFIIRWLKELGFLHKTIVEEEFTLYLLRGVNITGKKPFSLKVDYIYGRIDCRTWNSWLCQPWRIARKCCKIHNTS